LSIEVTLVFPAYNEAEGIGHAIEAALVELRRVSHSFEIIIAEDGSSDGTDAEADRLVAAHSEVRHLHSTERLGRGRALNIAFKESKGSMLVYMDVDLASDITQLRALIDSIRGGADVATGSRMLPGSRVKRSLRRSFASWWYNALIRVLFRTPVHDHQCGFKAFRRESLMEYIDEVEDTHWFWDTEACTAEATPVINARRAMGTQCLCRGRTYSTPPRWSRCSVHRTSSGTRTRRTSYQCG
jgi:glycosyltransferase involved in cell wall biosynthesis